MIIGMVNQKGGVGKTTLSINIADCIARCTESRVLLIDADKQGSAIAWINARSDKAKFTVIGLASDQIHKQIDDIAKDYDHVIIDAPAQLGRFAQSIIRSSDVVIIPVKPSPADVWAADDVINLCEQAHDINKNLKYFFAVNQKIQKTAIGQSIKKSLAAYSAGILDSEIMNRVVFATSFNDGQSVFDIDASSAASKEILAMTNEILEKAQ